jgi:hypothetical protein
MAESGNCVEIPSYIASVKECIGEFIGTQNVDGAYKDLSTGNCNDPTFELQKSLAAGCRYIYIDEINADWRFRR